MTEYMSQYLTTQEKGKEMCGGAKGDRRRGGKRREVKERRKKGDGR